MSNRPNNRPRRAAGAQMPRDLPAHRTHPAEPPARPRDSRADEENYSDTAADGYDEAGYDEYENERPETRDQRMEATGQFVTVALAGQPMRVIPAGGWPVSSQRALRNGDLDGFMAAVLHEDDYDLYVDIDPTADEFNQFIEDANSLSSQSQGKGGGRRPSSRPTRRR